MKNTLWTLMGSFCVTVSSVIVLSIFLNDRSLQYLSVENGPIEIFTALAFLGAALSGAYAYSKRSHRIVLYGSIAMLLAFMRELDLHRQWTTDSIFKTNFYLVSAAPLHEKIMGLLVICAICGLLLQILKRSFEWIRRLQKKDFLAWALGVGLLSLASGKAIDSMARIIPVAQEFHTTHYRSLSFVEECLELTGSVLFLVVFALLARSATKSFEDLL